MVASPALKTIGTSRAYNTSDTTSMKECQKDRSDKPVHDEGYDAFASHQKYMFLVQSYIGQEYGRTRMVAAPALETIGAFPSKNTSNTSSRKVCEKDGAKNQIHDDGDDAIASHQKSQFF